MTTPGRAAALAIWRAALAAGDVGPLVRSALRRDGDFLQTPRWRIDLAPIARVIVIGCGKAGASMAAAAEAILGDRVSEGFVVVKDGYRAPTRLVEIVEAGHPLPDTRGEAAAQRLLDLAAGAGADDLVLFLVSGGGSALTPAPVAGVTLAEKQVVTRLLLAAGATINELNAVRKHVSRLKGGQLARVAAPARVVTLALSDVVGDPIDVIASGPTAPDSSTHADALRVLGRRGILAAVPRSVRDHLEAGTRGERPETPKPGDPIWERVENVIIGNNGLIVEAAVREARRLGFRTDLVTRQLQGEAREVAQDLVRRARLGPPPACVIAAGETTVTVRGHGRGGRCQELALAAALEIGLNEPLTLLAAGTDGTDGPTDAAGAVVDARTIHGDAAAPERARAALDDNDSYAFLSGTGDLIVSGPTNTNLLDLYVALYTPASQTCEAI